MSSLILLLVIGLVAAEFDYEIHRKFETLTDSEFVIYFNSLNHSWHIKENSEDMDFGDMHLGAMFDDNHGFPIMTHDVMDLPKEFDAREQWPHCETIKEIYKQGECGSCYLFGTINSISDRTCIHNDLNVHLSEQEGDCINPSRVCLGGLPSEVLKYWIKNGLVSEDCKPYDIPSFYDTVCSTECVNGLDYMKDKHFGATAYKVDSNIDAIRAEIVKNGPVVASFNVYYDITKYDVGIYTHKFGMFKGRHAIRIIGFGVNEEGVGYWLAANSWGREKGVNGLFKIAQGQAELELEENVFAGIPRKS